MIGPPERKRRRTVISTAATLQACIWPRCLGAGPVEAECSAECAHPHDTPALCDLFASSEPVALGAEGELYGEASTVEAASDGARYGTLVADPPWPVARRMGAGGRRRRPTAVPYEFMSYEAIEALPVAAVAADRALLFLWATRHVFREGIAARVARAWGFEPCGELVWGLRNPGLGAGALVNDHEPVLIASRGGLAPEPIVRGLGVHFWRQPYAGRGGKIHSAKPDAFLDLAEQLGPPPRLELFARRQRLGWDTWGNEARVDVELGGAA